MLQSFQNCFKIPELREKILFTVGILVIYRIGGQITVPGVQVAVIQEFFSNSGNELLGMYDMFVGGNFTRAAIFALGIMPYISASIIFQLLGAVIPTFQKLLSGCKNDSSIPCILINFFSAFFTLSL